MVSAFPQNLESSIGPHCVVDMAAAENYGYGGILGRILTAVESLISDLSPEECLKGVLYLLSKVKELISIIVNHLPEKERIAKHEAMLFCEMLTEHGRLAADFLRSVLGVADEALEGRSLRSVEAGLKGDAPMTTATMNSYLIAIERELRTAQLRLDAFQRSDIQQSKDESEAKAREYEGKGSAVSKAKWVLVTSAVALGGSLVFSGAVWKHLTTAKKLLTIPQALGTLLTSVSAHQCGKLQKCYEEIVELLLTVNRNLTDVERKVTNLKHEITVCSAAMQDVRPDEEDPSRWPEYLDPLAKLKRAFQTLQQKANNALSELDEKLAAVKETPRQD